MNTTETTKKIVMDGLKAIATLDKNLDTFTENTNTLLRKIEEHMDKTDDGKTASLILGAGFLTIMDTIDEFVKAQRKIVVGYSGDALKLISALERSQ